MELNGFDDDRLNLEIMAEEFAEVILVCTENINLLTELVALSGKAIQAKSKMIRFGVHDFHPKNGMPNREKLEEEIGHVLALIKLLTKRNIIRQVNLDKSEKAKYTKMKKWYRERPLIIVKE